MDFPSELPGLQARNSAALEMEPSSRVSAVGWSGRLTSPTATLAPNPSRLPSDSRQGSGAQAAGERNPPGHAPSRAPSRGSRLNSGGRAWPFSPDPGRTLPGRLTFGVWGCPTRTPAMRTSCCSLLAPRMTPLRDVKVLVQGHTAGPDANPGEDGGALLAASEDAAVGAGQAQDAPPDPRTQVAADAPPRRWESPRHFVSPSRADNDVEPTPLPKGSRYYSARAPPPRTRPQGVLAPARCWRPARMRLFHSDSDRLSRRRVVPWLSRPLRPHLSLRREKRFPAPGRRPRPPRNPNRGTKGFTC